MKTTLQNLKKRLLVTGLAVAAFMGVQAQCSTSTAIAYQSPGNYSYDNTSSFTSGWDSYISINFGDGNNSGGTGTSFSITHAYLTNGTYLVASNLFAYDPIDSTINCQTTEYDTIVVSNIPCSVSVSSMNHTNNGGAYSFNASYVSGNPGVQTAWLITDSLGNNIYSLNGTDLTNMSFTFSQEGFYSVGFSATAYDSLTATYCSDSTYAWIYVANPSTCGLEANVFAYSTGALTASIFGQANNSFTWSYLTVDGQMFPATDSMNYTFPGAGSYNICYYVEDSTQATFCYDSLCILYTISGPVQCNAIFDLWEDSLNVGQWYAINYSVGAGAMSYLWDFGDGTTSTLAYPVHNYAVPGNYIICLSIADGNGCSSSTCDSSAAFRISQQQSTNSIIGSLTVTAPTVGIAENHSVLAEPKVFPNPMTETSSVTFNSSLSATGKIEVVNILGATVLSENVVIAKGNNEFKLNTSTLNNGVYYVNIIAENRVLSTVKAVK